MSQTPTSPTIDLSRPRRVHVVGAGGSGMSAIAEVLVAMGHLVSGSDAVESAALGRVGDKGADVWVGHYPERIDDLDAVVVSSAIPGDDPEVTAAVATGIPVLRRFEMLAAIASTRKTIAVAGTHGKTTTSTLLVHALEHAGDRPSYIIGAEIVGRGNGARWEPDGEWFVVEADESDGTFLRLDAAAAIVTNIEPDHLETYGGWEQLKKAFETFVRQTSGPVVMCGDDANCAELALRLQAEGLAVHTYGSAASPDDRPWDCSISDVDLDRFSSRFELTVEGETCRVELPVPGMHNVSNATAAVLVTELITGSTLGRAAAGVEEFSGVGRRFQRRGESNGITFVDDYAHLPTEVRAAIAAARAGHWERIVVVFQPHRYSRTEQVGADFAGSFDQADHLFLTDVYPAGEAPRPGIDGRLVRDAVLGYNYRPPLEYVEDRADLARVVAAELRPGDLCLTLGAGDITGLADEIVAELT